MPVAKVAVAAAVYAIDKPYDYLVPPELEAEICPGMRVAVPFGQGSRRTEGLVLMLAAESEFSALKQVEGLLDREPVLSETMLRMAEFLRERYFCTYFDAVRAMLPAGLWFHARDRVVLTALGQSADLPKKLARSPEALEVAEQLKILGGQAEEAALRKYIAPEVLEKGVRALVRKNLAISEETLIRNVSDKTEQVASLTADPNEALEYARTRKRAPLQKAVLEMLVVLGSCSVKELKYFTGASLPTFKSLEKAGYIELSHREMFRRPEFSGGAPVELALNPEQQEACDGLMELVRAEKGVALLYGVTGSGKTAVYLKLIEECLRRGRSALVLVPEISLTPQLMQTFMAQFGDRVAVLHSALQAGERYDEWKRIRQGKATVVVGTRSAVFAPLRNPGLIVVDEEHESSYKSEMNPRYHAREAAIWRGFNEKCAVVLGSATPSVESMYLAKTGVYRLFVLRGRYGGRPLPQVTLTDMKEELKAGNSTALSAFLRKEMEKNFAAGEQTILFLNRRGASRTVLCPVCGHVPECPRCSVSLTYHSANRRLMCHYCGYSEPAAAACPECGGEYRQVGSGTQKVEEEVKAIWPWAETIRMDADTVSATNPHEKILSRFQTEKIPVLIGTQMVTKGLNFPNVTLVGVLDGDSALYTDDFRAAETTFSKITQVVGRAGRGEGAGRAVIQTMTPENQVLMQAARQDYDAFFETELPLRQIRFCPPFADVFQVRFSGMLESEVAGAALRFRQALSQALGQDVLAGQKALMMGPAPAAVVKVMNRYRYQLTLLTKNSRPLRDLLSGLLKWFAGDRQNARVSATVDVNPLN